MKRKWHIKPGGTFQTTEPDQEDGHYMAFRHWKVVELYENFALCESGIRRECFTFGELLTMGLEKQAPKYEALRVERGAMRYKDDYKRNYNVGVEE